MTNKPYNNTADLYDSIFRTTKMFIGKSLRADYIVLSEGLSAHFEFYISDDYEAEEFTDEVIMTIKTLGANHIRIYNPEEPENTVFETACYHGGVKELDRLVANGILDDEGVPAYFKEFISLKKQLIEKITGEKDVIINLLKSKDSKDVRTPFRSDVSNFTNGRICSSLFAAQETMERTVNETIFTNEEYKILLADDCLSWCISDHHSEALSCSDLYENDCYLSMEQWFYGLAEMMLETKAALAEIDNENE